jgi:uncharacterized protein with NAD-binding domain and iron-sulfur cluster
MIIGGGVGAMTAAWSLATSKQNLDITVYQMGWRLGGKGASGRNLEAPYHARIEEHGVHVWSGLYENAFRAMREVYLELGRAPDAPLAQCFDAFLPHDIIALEEFYQGKWYPWIIRVPTNAQLPGNQDATLLPSLWAYATEAVRFVTMLVQDLFNPQATALKDKTGIPTAHIDQRHQSSIISMLESLLLHLAEGIAELLLPVWNIILRLLKDMLEALWLVVKNHLDDTAVRRAWIMGNFVYANLAGAFAEDVFANGLDFLDQYDYREWMAKYAIHDDRLMLDSPWAYFMYDAEFAYIDGDTNRPDIAAGASLKTLIRMAFTYKGALIWKMQAGMGDTVFAPFYLALKKRGVKFKFFNRIDALHLDPKDPKSVHKITVGLQAKTKDDAEYNPLVTVNGLPCWPSDTLWDQIEAPTDHSLNLENPAVPPLLEYTLEQGKDYDAIVLATPIATLPIIAKELIAASPKWQAMVQNITTVRTQALQLWLTPTAYQLGWHLMGQPLLAGFHASPLNTWADMSHLLGRESWPYEEGRYPLHIAYFCGPMLTTSDPEAENRRTVLNILQNSIGWLWPDATTQPTMSGPLNWDLLVDDRAEPGKGEARLDAQYLRANYWPAEQFTLTLHGKTQYRLAPNESGFASLVLAGDWTNNGFNIGNVEATTMSGMLASNALTGYPAREQIIGVDFGRSPKGEP